MTATTDPHDGLTCTEVETVLSLRCDQLTAARGRLAWREEQATTRLTPDQQRGEYLAVIAAVEAVQRGDREALDALAPKTVAAQRVQLTALITAVADLSEVNPGLTDSLRAWVLRDDHEEDQ